MANILKKTTGLTGIAVSQHPHREILMVYDKLLRLLSELPEISAYKKHTTKLVQERRDIVLQNKSVETIEKKIGCGQIEELIIQAKNELNFVKNITLWKPWENLSRDAPPRQWDWPPHK